jgi:hypothetical protein
MLASVLTVAKSSQDESNNISQASDSAPPLPAQQLSSRPPRASGAEIFGPTLAPSKGATVFRRGAIPPLFRLFRIPRRFCGFAFQTAPMLARSKRFGCSIDIVAWNAQFPVSAVPP